MAVQYMPRIWEEVRTGDSNLDVTGTLLTFVQPCYGAVCSRAPCKKRQRKKKGKRKEKKKKERKKGKKRGEGKRRGKGGEEEKGGRKGNGREEEGIIG